MYRRTKVAAFACITRLIVVATQAIANTLIPDHEAKVFRYPKANLTNSVADKAVDVALGGFVRWDAQYFMHIAKYGYTYENTLAFFPLYPLTVRAIAVIASEFLVFLNEDSVYLLTFIVLNVFIFIKTVQTLYELSLAILNEDLAYKAAVLFCINPATVFFIAPYTECLFCYLTFKCMLNCVLIYGKHSIRTDIKSDFKRIIGVIVPIGLSTCTRSNGMLNIGFGVYFITQWYIKYLRSEQTLVNQIVLSIESTILLILCVSLSLIPFILVQIYDYVWFCMNFNHNLPEFLVNFAQSNNFILPGSVAKHNQSWCFKQIPLAYSYIQDHYWDVGFLRYFAIKQIPNFMLASPVVALVVINSLRFFKQHREYCMNLGIFKFKFNTHAVKPKFGSSFKPEMFVFIVHALFLTLFCVFCIHVQVTTRMICSASPVVYWFGAYYFEKLREQGGSLQDMFLFHRNKTRQQRFLMCYFLCYCLFGTVLFCNFLPWT